MLIVFRTSDLGAVPKTTWKAIGPVIEEARKEGLRIHQLEANSVCEIHAARDLYSDALQGNIDEKSADVLAWLKAYFEPRVLQLFQTKVPGETKRKISDTKPVPVAPVTPVSVSLTEAERSSALQFVEKRRWVSVEEVLKHLKLSVTVEVLIKGIESPNIKAFPGPKTIVLQWRKTASA